MIFAHTTVGSSDAAEAERFYTPVLAELGLEKRGGTAEEGWLHYGHPDETEAFWVVSPLDEAPATAGNGVTIALLAPSRAAVRAFYAAAMANGGVCEGGPGLRPAYGRHYYAAYVRDPTGNKICAACHAGASTYDDLNHFMFGDGPKLGDRLAALVVAGRKTATVASTEGLPDSVVGQRHVVTDGRRRPVCVIETTDYCVRQFDEIDAEFAACEGEGDLSLTYWQTAHRTYFTRAGVYAPDMKLYAESFELVQILDQRFAARAPAEVAAEIAETPAYMALHADTPAS